MPDRLPIYELENDIVARLKEAGRLVISAPTGSGKSTQVPQMLLKHKLLDRGEVVILQPRRIAARLLAARVAEELGVPLGREVGYQVRFESVVSAATKIRFVTEGILLRRMIDDSSLAGVSTIIFDEFHERHLYGDVSLARALDLRPDLRLIVMSATLDVDKIADYIKPCAVLRSDGRTFPVDIRYEEGDAADAFARHADRGDTLIFMPGSYEIHRTIDAIRARPESKGRLVLPLHGELPPHDQDAAVARHAQPKVIVSTNVAETSLTIDGVTLVIDSGLARIARHDPNRGINTLFVEKISRASADQRAGRAGRTAPGLCIRLWPEREPRAPRELPEVKRLDLSEVVLFLRAAGIKDVKWLDAPDAGALDHAEELLTDLGALTNGAITGIGRRMLAVPTHPRYARMLIAAQELGCPREAALVAALTQGRDLLLRNVDGHTTEFREDRFMGKGLSDFDVLMRAWTWAAERSFRFEDCQRAGIHAVTARQAASLYEQFVRIAGDKSGSPDALRKCILLGFADRVAHRLDEGTLRCELVHGRRGTLARESVVRSPLFVATEVREVERKKVDTILSLATAIEPSWLSELFPDDMNRRTFVDYDSAARRVVAFDQLRFRDLVLDSKSVDPPSDAAAKLLANEVVEGRLRLPEWNDAVEQWIVRVNLLAKACADLALPPIDDAARREIIAHVCHGATSYKEIKDKSVKPFVRGWLSAAQQDLVEQHLPERVTLSNGRTPKVAYSADGATIAAKIQDLYGVTRVPAIAMGRLTPSLQILAPNQRPVQVTQDLAGFWRDHYPRVKKELQRKYPKHEWQ